MRIYINVKGEINGINWFNRKSMARMRMRRGMIKIRKLKMMVEIRMVWGLMIMKVSVQYAVTKIVDINKKSHTQYPPSQQNKKQHDNL